MRIESSVTAVTWVPFAVLDSMPDLPLGIAVAHYDEPPGELLGDVDSMREADAFREANELRAWIEVEDGRISGYGRSGRGLLGGRRLDLGADQVAFPAVELPVIQPEPELVDGAVRFRQTVGARIGLPAPRALDDKPYFHVGSATAWTTLELVMRADGSSERRLVASSPLPRHSIYDADGVLVDEQGADDYEGWHRQTAGASPWSDDVAGAELDRELDRIALRNGARPQRRRLGRGETLVEQGEAGCDMFLLVDGVLDVEVDDVVVAQVGSGALLGERAVLGDGRRTATLRAVHASRVAILQEEAVGDSRLAQLVAERRVVRG
jgi:hypothetical protein